MKTLSNLQHEKSVDFAGFITLNPEGQKFFFRKNKGRLVDEVFKKRTRLLWLDSGADFPLYTKKC
jgi:hypothetical protein